MEHDSLSIRTARTSKHSLGLRSSAVLLTRSESGWLSRRNSRSKSVSLSRLSKAVAPSRRSNSILLSFLLLLGFGTLAQNACAQSIIPARPGAINGGNPIEGLGRPDDPNPSREADYSSRFDPYANDSTEGSEAKSDETQSRNDDPQAKSDSAEARNGSSETTNGSSEAINESSEARNEGAEAKHESAEAKSESGEARHESAEAKSEFGEARRESAEGKHEFAEGQSESKDAFNEGAESKNDTAAESDSGESGVGRSTQRKGSLVPILVSPQPGQTIRRGGFSNFSKEQEAARTLDLKLRALEKARQKAAEKQSAKTETKGDKADKAEKTDKTDKATANKTDTGDATKSDGNKSATGKSSKVGASKADATKKGTPAASAAAVRAADGSSTAARKLSHADQLPSKSGGGGRSSKQGLVPPPPPYTVPLVSKSNDTPERKALELINKKKFAIAESKLQDLISENPDNCHARYLLGISLVMQRKYDEARKEYAFVVEHSTDEKLIDLANQGLQKL